MIEEAVAIDGGPDPQGNAEGDADDDGDSRHLGGGGKYADQVFQHRMGGQGRHAEIGMQHVPGVSGELVPDGQVEAHGLLDLVVGRLACPVADCGKHGIDRHQPADHEGDEKKSEEGGGKRERKAADGEKQAPRSL